MNILVTGAAGFVGMSISKKLLENNYNVVGIDNINSYYDRQLKYDRLKILKKFKNFKFNKVDICNEKKLKEIFLTKKFDIVINLAAQAGVRYSVIHPELYISSNINGFFNVINQSVINGVKTFIYASSSSVYGGSKEYPFEESQNTSSPLNIYAATKLANEHIAHAFSHLHKIKTIGLRFFTAYGPWGRPDMALAIFTQKIINGEQIEIYNNGNMYRDFTYIDDLVYCIDKLIEKTYNKQQNKSPAGKNSTVANHLIVNIGNGYTVKLLTYLKAIELALGKKANIRFSNMNIADVEKTQASTSKLNKLIKEMPKTKIDDGVAKYVKWHMTYYK